jgi:glycosyltransferase involved in cell wall biosynthesis
MRILMVTREYPPYAVGGVATHTYHLTEALRRLGAEVKVISFGNPRRSSDHVKFIGPLSAVIKKRPSGIGEALGILYDIARFTRAVNREAVLGCYDLVHVQEPYVGGFIRFRTKVTTIHDTSYGEVMSIFSHEASRDWKRLSFYLGLGYLMEYASGASSG